MNRHERIELFVQEIWNWFSVHKRTLPWRDLTIKDDTERAYQILVSEVMLQQTQVSRVKIVFRNFLDRFATMQDLAQASNKDVILAWRGMGYNSRALRLRDAAKTIVEEHHGIFPKEMHQLRSIKGIGPYTAAAIRNFAFNIPTPCIDTNIRRILHRTFVGAENSDGTWKKDDHYLSKIAGEILAVAVAAPNLPVPLSPLCPPSTCPPSPLRGGRRDESIQETSIQKNSLSRARGRVRVGADGGKGWDRGRFGEGLGVGSKTPAAWHAALMDFGSLVQTKNNPKWDVCPLTAKGIMVTTSGLWAKRLAVSGKRLASDLKKEPGREVAGKFIPNRIFRGRIIEQLRDAKMGLDLEAIGRSICIDWEAAHREWLGGLLEKLKKDQLIVQRKRGYVLKD